MSLTSTVLLKLGSHNTLSFEGKIKVNEYVHTNRNYLNITVHKRW